MKKMEEEERKNKYALKNKNQDATKKRKEPR